MTIDTAPITLYGLSLRSGQNINVGPYAWKTEVNLGTLGVPYTLEGRTFDEIRGSFETQTSNPTVSVPTLQIGNEYVTDSWAIAEYLDSKYGTPERSLFPGGTEGKALAHFFNLYADIDLGDQVKILFAPWLYQAQTPEASAWFLKTKLGGNQAAIDGLVAAAKDSEWVANQAAVVRSKLATLEKQLAANKAAGRGPFLAGTAYPTHADAAVFGWYGASAAVQLYDVVALTWKHEDNPLVAAWVDKVQEASGARPDYSSLKA